MALNPAEIETLSKLLDVALELEPGQREAWIASLTPEEQSLAEPLREMLANDGRLTTDQRFDQLPRMSQNEEIASKGEVVGPYRLLHEIGRGGMGSVWLAERSDGSFKRQVALKLPRLAWGAGLAERMAREREIGALLEHPAIARMYDAGVDERGRPYLAFQYIDGQPIDAWCESQALTLRQRLSLFLQVIKAVAYAHGRLVVHRDLKPSNVMVTLDGQAHLLDFGIAKLLQDANQAEANLTQEQGRVLTPHYASPEQIAGEPITVASDVYSLGVLLYELLTGVLPVAPRRETRAAIEEAVLEGDIALASTRVKDKTTARALRGELDAILTKAMQRDPQRRYATADALAQDIQRYLQGETVSARPDSLTYRMRKALKRHWVVVLATAAVLIASIAGVAGTLVQAERAERASILAAAERDRALKELHFAESINEFVSFLLSESGGKAFTTIELMARAEGLLDKQFGKDPGVRARLQMLVAERYGNVGRTEKALQLLEQSRQLANDAHEPNLRANADCQLALELSQQGQTQRAQTLFNDALGTFRQTVPKDVKGLAQCLVSLSMAQSQSRADPLSALAHADEAIALFKSLPNPVADTLINAHEAAAGAHGMLGHMSQAVSEYELVLKNLAALGRERSSDTIITRQNLGVFLSKGGQSLRAVAVYEDALDITRGMDNKDFVDSSLLANYAKALIDVGRAGEAIPLFEKALGSATLNNDKYGIAVSELQAAAAYRKVGDLDRCGALLLHARQDLMALRPPTDTLFGSQALSEAELALLQGQTDRAKQLLQQSVKIYQGAKARNPIVIRALTLLARVEQRQGFPTEAKAHLEQSLTWAREASTGFDRSAWMGVALHARAVVLHAQGDQAGAKLALAEALPHLDTSLGDKAPETVEAHKLDLTLRSSAG
jgi:serine/threonine-protein kinase